MIRKKKPKDKIPKDTIPKGSIVHAPPPPKKKIKAKLPPTKIEHKELQTHNSNSSPKDSSKSTPSQSRLKSIAKKIPRKPKQSKQANSPPKSSRLKRLKELKPRTLPRTKENTKNFAPVSDSDMFNDITHVKTNPLDNKKQTNQRPKKTPPTKRIRTIKSKSAPSPESKSPVSVSPKQMRRDENSSLDVPTKIPKQKIPPTIDIPKSGKKPRTKKPREKIPK